MKVTSNQRNRDSAARRRSAIQFEALEARLLLTATPGDRIYLDAPAPGSTAVSASERGLAAEVSAVRVNASAELRLSTLSVGLATDHSAAHSPGAGSQGMGRRLEAPRDLSRGFLPDLRAFSFDADLGGDDVVSVSETITLYYDYENIGAAPVVGNSYDIGFYLSTDATVTTADLFLAFIDGVDLGPGAITNGTIGVTLPAAGSPFWIGEGSYYLGMIVDDLNGVVEADEFNNTLADDLDVFGTGIATPDLRAFAFDADVGGDDIVNAGETISVFYDYDNIGTAAVAGINYDIGFYLSRDANVGPGDPLLTFIDGVDLGAGGFFTNGTVNVALPGAADAFWTGGASSYYIVMYVDDLNGVFEFELNNQRADDFTLNDDHSNSSNSATRISADSFIGGELEVLGDTDWFTFDAEIGTQLTLLTTLFGLQDSTLTLYAADGITILESNDDIEFPTNLASRIVYTTTVTGTYYVSVDAFSDLYIGNYGLSLTHVDDHAEASPASPVVINSSLGGIIEINGDFDTFSFFAMAGRDYGIRTELGTLHDSTLTLFDVDNFTQLAFDDDGGPGLASLIEFTAPATGTYFVDVAAYMNLYVGSYTIFVEELLQDGDFNDDNVYDCLDINALVAAIVAGDPAFDLTGDGITNLLDRDAWLAEAAIARGYGTPIKLGDANLDGTVDGQDFIAWNANKFTTVAEWCRGDFTADGTVDGQDFIAWNANKFTMSDALRETTLSPTKELLEPQGSRELAGLTRSNIAPGRRWFASALAASKPGDPRTIQASVAAETDFNLRRAASAVDKIPGELVTGDVPRRFEVAASMPRPNGKVNSQFVVSHVGRRAGFAEPTARATGQIKPGLDVSFETLG